MRILPFFIAVCASLVVACPLFVEFFPDPTDVPDDDGEYVEIRLDDFWADSLVITIDEKKKVAYPYPKGKRFLLVQNLQLCPEKEELVCAELGSSLPNSRESIWKLNAGSCTDSVLIPKPKAGKAIQRVKDSDEWIFTTGTLGTPDPNYEVGIKDCALDYLKADFLENFWKISGALAGCDSAILKTEFLNLNEKTGWKKRNFSVTQYFAFEISEKGSLQFRSILPEDEIPQNDTLDTLFIAPEKSPLVISEVHHCPKEPEPEWIEIFNKSPYALALNKIRFCHRDTFLGAESDSIRPFETLILTKDSLEMREYLGFFDVKIQSTSFGYLNNQEGAIALCYANGLLDSIAWNKTSANCPNGFSPLSGLQDNSPGFLKFSKTNEKGKIFRYKLSARVVSKKGNALKIQVESEENITLKLLDAGGRDLWKTIVSARNNTWNEIPAQKLCAVGVCYVSLSLGSYTQEVGIVVRP